MPTTKYRGRDDRDDETREESGVVVNACLWACDRGSKEQSVSIRVREIVCKDRNMYGYNFHILIPLKRDR